VARCEQTSVLAEAAGRLWLGEPDWTSTSADASESVLPVADSARFRRRVRVQDNRPCASRLKASGVRAKQKRRTGDAIRRGDPTGGYASVPAVSQWHLCVSRGSSTREQEDLEVRGGIGIANQSGSVVSSQGSTTPSNSYLSSIVRARPQHLKKAPEPSHRALLIANLVHRRNSLSTCSPS
jgi:hypothetical protein